MAGNFRRPKKVFHDSNWQEQKSNEAHYASLYDPKLEDFPYLYAPEKATAGEPVKNSLTRSLIKRPINSSLGKLKVLRKSANLDGMTVPIKKDHAMVSKQAQTKTQAVPSQDKETQMNLTGASSTSIVQQAVAATQVDDANIEPHIVMSSSHQQLESEFAVGSRMPTELSVQMHSRAKLRTLVEELTNKYVSPRVDFELQGATDLDATIELGRGSYADSSEAILDSNQRRKLQLNQPSVKRGSFEHLLSRGKLHQVSGAQLGSSIEESE